MRPGAVQIAGVHDLDEAELLASCGVDFVGVPLRLGYHAEDCTAREAARIVAALAGRVETVLITYLEDPVEIASFARSLGVGWVQLHAAIAPASVAVLRSRAPELQLAKSLVVRGNDLAALTSTMDAHTPHVDAFLTAARRHAET